MTDDVDGKRDQQKQDELNKIQDELKDAGVSRRHFLDRLKVLGVGFGAAFVLGVREARAIGQADPGVAVKSTNPAVDDILSEGQKTRPADRVDPNADPEDARVQLAQYGRFYRRGYGRWYGRYGRLYRRFYGRYARFYGRYRRFYMRF
jgi:hypothetical protein